MADGIVLAAAVFGVGLGLIGFRRPSVLSLGIIGSASALAAAGWLIVRTSGSEIIIEFPSHPWTFSTLPLICTQAILVILNAGLLLAATLFEKAKPSFEASSRWHFGLAVALNLIVIMPDDRSSAAAYFAFCCVAAAAPPTAIAVRPLFILLGGSCVALSALMISHDGLIQELRLNPRLVALVGTAAGFAMAVLAIDVRRAFDRPDRLYSAAAVLLAVAAAWFQLQSTVAVSLRANAVIAASIATGAILSVAWTARGVKPAATRNVSLRLVEAFVRFEAAVEASLQSQNRSADESRRLIREATPVSLSVYWALAAAAGLAAVAIASRSAVGGP